MVLTEGELRFTFPGEKAIKFDETDFYRLQFNKLLGAKGVDFICDTDKFLLLLEVKDCSGDEANNRWRIATNDEKVTTTLTTVNTDGRESLDNEVAHKVALTISCLLGAQTYGDVYRPRFKAKELIPYAKALEGEKIVQRNKDIFVVLFLEGEFSSDTRPKSAIMKRIRDTLETKLDWLNCKVSVEDIDTYRKDEHALFQVERMT